MSTRSNASQRAFSEVLGDLDRIHDEIWSKLQVAAKSAAHGWHLPVLGNSAGGRCCLRTVVLRAVDAERYVLMCHTDRRSEKVVHIEADPHVSWLFYDTESRVQLRIDSLATVHCDDPLADERWRSSRLESRRCYLAPMEPRRRLPQQTINLPPDLCERVPTEAEAAAGRDNFAVVSARVRSLEWLYLCSSGNLSARYEMDDDGRVASTWLTP